MSTLIHLDSADHYASAEAYLKWFSSPSIVTAGRTGKGWHGGAKVFNPLQYNTFGFAHKGSPGNVIELTNVAGATSLIVNWATDSRFRLSLGYFGDKAYSAWSDITICREDQWFYLELQTNYSVTWEPLGVVHWVHTVDFTLKINEETILTDTISWTKAGSDLGFTRIDWGGAGNVVEDDYYMTDTEFLGDIRIYVIRPNAEGDLNEWTSANGGLNYNEVKDTNPDFDATYIYTVDLNKISLVNLEDISLIGEIKGIQFNAVCIKSDAGGAAFRSYNKISGNLIEDSTDIYPSYSGWLDRTIAMRKNPVTSLDFTVSEVNSLQAGVKRTL